mmetsp:Transcript_26255/g.66766  ORF Transcript_26255/g.66766 Transcript_26255/m.66766 type:complete len:828 (+) Transcript_26255:5371-7854(+)
MSSGEENFTWKDQDERGPHQLLSLDKFYERYGASKWFPLTADPDSDAYQQERARFSAYYASDGVTACLSMDPYDHSLNPIHVDWSGCQEGFRRKKTGSRERYGAKNFFSSLCLPFTGDDSVADLVGDTAYLANKIRTSQRNFHPLVEWFGHLLSTDAGGALFTIENTFSEKSTSIKWAHLVEPNTTNVIWETPRLQYKDQNGNGGQFELICFASGGYDWYTVRIVRGGNYSGLLKGYPFGSEDNPLDVRTYTCLLKHRPSFQDEDFFYRVLFYPVMLPIIQSRIRMYNMSQVNYGSISGDLDAINNAMLRIYDLAKDDGYSDFADCFLHARVFSMADLGVIMPAFLFDFWTPRFGQLKSSKRSNFKPVYLFLDQPSDFGSLSATLTHKGIRHYDTGNFTMVVRMTLDDILNEDGSVNDGAWNGCSPCFWFRNYISEHEPFQRDEGSFLQLRRLASVMTEGDILYRVRLEALHPFFDPGQSFYTEHDTCREALAAACAAWDNAISQPLFLTNDICKEWAKLTETGNEIDAYLDASVKTICEIGTCTNPAWSPFRDWSTLEVQLDQTIAESSCQGVRGNFLEPKKADPACACTTFLDQPDYQTIVHSIQESEKELTDLFNMDLSRFMTAIDDRGLNVFTNYEDLVPSSSFTNLPADCWFEPCCDKGRGEVLRTSLAVDKRANCPNIVTCRQRKITLKQLSETKSTLRNECLAELFASGNIDSDFVLALAKAGKVNTLFAGGANALVDSAGLVAETVIPAEDPYEKEEGSGETSWTTRVLATLIFLGVGMVFVLIMGYFTYFTRSERTLVRSQTGIEADPLRRVSAPSSP